MRIALVSTPYGHEIELMQQTGDRVAFIFLPLTFITGLLGMYVDGIPYADQEWAYWGAVMLCFAVAAVVIRWFAGRRWQALAGAGRRWQALARGFRISMEPRQFGD